MNDSITASHFAARSAGIAASQAPRVAESEHCWLCGGSTNGRGWRREDWLKPTFTNHNQARRLDSDAVCEWCVAMSSKEPWETYVRAHPAMGLKTGHAVSWRFYSHVFTEHGHRCPTRPEWPGILMEPPAPPFLLVLTTSGQKHLIFRSRVSHDRESYWLQFEEDALLLQRDCMRSCIETIEDALRHGVMRSEIESGMYRTKRPAGCSSIGEWTEILDAIEQRRTTMPHEFRVSIHVARKQEVVAAARTTEPHPQPAAQGALF